MYEIAHLNDQIKNTGILKQMPFLDYCEIDGQIWRSVIKNKEVYGPTLTKLKNGVVRLILLSETILDSDYDDILPLFDQIRPILKKSIEVYTSEDVTPIVTWIEQVFVPMLEQLENAIDEILQKTAGTEIAESKKNTSRKDKLSPEARAAKMKRFGQKSFEELQAELELKQA